MRWSERQWVWPALGLVLVVTGLRWALLAHDRTDLFVDETQYWLWSRNLDWGYFSKPPLIAWLIGGVTSVLGDSGFAVRMPGAALHGATALVLGFVAARRVGPEAALTAVAIYLWAPFVAVGSLMISTDTVMLPFLAIALWAHMHLIDSRRLRWALIAGLSLGLGSLGKYAGLYGLAAFLLGNVFAESRIGWRASLVLVASCAAVLMPNLVWNLQNQFATLSATGDNIGWVKGQGTVGGLSEAAEFVASQFIVFGPLTFVAMLVGLWRGRRDLALFALLPLVVVTVQAGLNKAYANWAVAAWVPGTILAAEALRNRRLRSGLALGVNLMFALALPLLTLVPEAQVLGRPVLKRYVGRADLSAEILALARAEGRLPVVTADRDILADLFYADRDWKSVAIFAPPPQGKARNYYEQIHALQPGFAAEVLYIGALPAGCTALDAPRRLVGHGVWAGKRIEANRIDPACLFP